jgi:hypothetical protein
VLIVWHDAIQVSADVKVDLRGGRISLISGDRVVTFEIEGPVGVCREGPISLMRLYEEKILPALAQLDERNR